MRAQDMRGSQEKNSKNVSQGIRHSRMYGDDEHADEFQRAGGSSAGMVLTVGCVGS